MRRRANSIAAAPPTAPIKAAATTDHHANPRARFEETAGVAPRFVTGNVLGATRSDPFGTLGRPAQEETSVSSSTNGLDTRT